MKIDQLPARYREQVSDSLAMETTRKRSKWKNIPIKVDGIRFDSKHEAAVYEKLKRVYGAERIIRQVSFPISLSERMRIDFLVIEVIEMNGINFTARFFDAKGRATDDWKRKARALERVHGIKVETM